MENLKIRVNSSDESKEVQDLLVKMGYHARKNWTERNPIHESIQAWEDGEFTFSLNHDQVPVGFKELTLPELRAMVKDQYAEIEQVRQHKKHEHNSSAWDVQIGGDHYKQFQIQPMQFALENKLDAAQQNVIKYIMRHSFKNGKQDLEKAKHYIDLMIEFYYGENNNG